MTEDKLSHDERLRLECLAQANTHTAMKHGASPEQVVETATRFEKFIKGEEA